MKIFYFLILLNFGFSSQLNAAPALPELDHKETAQIPVYPHELVQTPTYHLSLTFKSISSSSRGEASVTIDDEVFLLEKQSLEVINGKKEILFRVVGDDNIIIHIPLTSNGKFFNLRKAYAYNNDPAFDILDPFVKD